MRIRILAITAAMLLAVAVSCGDDDDGPVGGGNKTPSAAHTTISANPNSITADGASTSAITVQLKNSDGDNLSAGGETVTLATDAGSLSAVTDNNDGTYTATLTASTTEETATVTGTLNGEDITDNATVDFVITASAATSTITASESAIVGDGVSTATITVQLKTAAGDNITTGGDNVTVATTAGNVSAVTDNGDGTYTATLTSAPPASPASVTMESDRDNTLYEDPTKSNGLGKDMFSGLTPQATNALRRCLVRFDLAGAALVSATVTGTVNGDDIVDDAVVDFTLPSAVVVDSVMLNLSVNKTRADVFDVTIHKVTSDWGEGTSNADNILGGGAGDDATNGDATWVNTFFPAQTWTTPGGDFVPAASATQAIDGLGQYTWGSTQEMVTDVRDWLANPGNNFGWIVISDEAGPPSTAYRFGTHENEAPNQRPSLVVHFTVP